MSDESIFAEALAIPSPSAREEYLDEACAGNPELRQEVDALLAAHAGENPLDRPPEYQVATELTDEGPPPAEVGDTIGPYRLMEQIGEGGFGLVFVAEQHAPVRRKVALKVLKPGMDTRDVVARFEAERQALALMDHPNIAKVLDAGSTPNGRPYFVMELVKGIPINQYCDEQRLSPTERLELFAQVCQAVQHAHQKGIIHRDIKPTNVLVTVIDGKPVPKVIDFGVAKAVGQNLTERTIYTRFAQMVGTPLYMSPEQAQLSGVDVDTRSDIYSLGVLLYELLTGTTPFDSKRFRTAALEEIRRIIREEDPPRPSHRLSSLGETLPSVSANRKTEPARLPGLIRGELDWIVMKCLEKDRGRRYETATSLAKDVQRFLSGEAVEACPPTLGYRLRKAYGKHRGTVLTTASFAVVLLVATGVSTWMAIEATRAKQETLGALAVAKTAENEATQALKEREKTFDYFLRVLDHFNLDKHNGIASIQDVLDRACDEIDNEFDDHVTRVTLRSEYANMFMKLHEYQRAHKQFWLAYEELRDADEFGPDHPATLKAEITLAKALNTGRQNLHDLEKAEELLRDASDRYARTEGEVATFEPRSELSSVLFKQARFADVVELRRRLLAMSLEHPQLASRSNLCSLKLADMLSRSADPEDIDEAKQLFEQVLKTYRSQYGEDGIETLRVKASYLRVSYCDHQDPQIMADYIGLLNRLIEHDTQEYGTEENSDVIKSMDNLAIFVLWYGDHRIADESTEKLLKYSPIVYGERHPLVKRHKVMRSWYLVRAEQYTEAEDLLKEIDLSEEAGDDSGFSGGWDNFTLIKGHWLYGICLWKRGELKPAQDHLIQASKFLDLRDDKMALFRNRFSLDEREKLSSVLDEIENELKDNTQ